MNARWPRSVLGAGALALASTFLLGGCVLAAVEPAPPPALSPPLFSFDFDGYPTGPLVAWRVAGGGFSAATIVPWPGRGQVLRLDGGPALGDFLVAGATIPPYPGDITVRFDVHPASGASGIFTLLGSGSGYSGRQLRLMRGPISSDLVAASSAGNVPCGPLPSGRWSTVTLRVHTALPRTFDVMIDGAPTACTSLPTRIQPPFVGINIMDASNLGWGGRMYFDDIRGM
ncbi:MAG: hypothetical protein IT372_26740 [Polyangiaceae bacterium]|nr:hypothetical protein [Polyangiaceae bacterium]